MTGTFLDLTENEFHRRFPLVPNPINPAAGWGVGDSPGCLFEPYGPELAFVRRSDPRRVWTLVDADGGPLLLSGVRHPACRVGYLVSRTPAPAGRAYRVRLSASGQTDCAS